MKNILLGACSSVLLLSCLTDGSAPPPENDFRLAMTSANRCGIESVAANFEVIRYFDDGTVSSRHAADEAGIVSFRSERETETLAIVEQRTHGLTVTVLVDQVITDLGNWYQSDTANRDGCECENYDITVRPGNLTSYHLNFSTSAMSSNMERTTYESVAICQPTGEREPLLVAFASSATKKTTDYFVSSQPSALANAQNEIDITVEDVGVKINIVTPENLTGSFHFVSDERNAFSVPYSHINATHAVEHERVKPTMFTTNRQFGIQYPIRRWSVRVPMTETTELIDVTEPVADFEQLRLLINRETEAFDFTQENPQDFLLYSATLKSALGFDQWAIVMPPKGELVLPFDLPTDYADRQGDAYLDAIWGEAVESKNFAYVSPEEGKSNPELLKELLWRGAKSERPKYQLETYEYFQ